MTSAGKMKNCKAVIHAVGPIWHNVIIILILIFIFRVKDKKKTYYTVVLRRLLRLLIAKNLNQWLYQPYLQEYLDFLEICVLIISLEQLRILQRNILKMSL